MYRYIDLFKLSSILDETSIQEIEDLFRLEVELYNIVDSLATSVCVGRIPSFYTVHAEGTKAFNIYGSLYKGAFDEAHMGTCNLAHPLHTSLTKRETEAEFQKYLKKLDNYNIKIYLRRLLPESCYTTEDILKFYRRMNTKYKMKYLNNLLYYLSTIYGICMYLKVYYLRLLENNLKFAQKDAITYFNYYKGSYSEILTHVDQLLHLTKRHRENLNTIRENKFNKIIESFKFEQF